jgi:hypothetical protein
MKLLILKILSTTLFKDPTAAILTLRMHTGSHLRLKIFWKPAMMCNLEKLTNSIDATTKIHQWQRRKAALEF